MKVRALVYSVAGVLAFTALWQQSEATHAQTPSSHHGTQAGALVRVVREVTERFRDVKAAEADGYALAFGCVSGGEYGAMGLHYVNFPLVLDGILDEIERTPRKESSMTMCGRTIVYDVEPIDTSHAAALWTEEDLAHLDGQQKDYFERRADDPDPADPYEGLG